MFKGILRVGCRSRIGLCKVDKDTVELYWVSRVISGFVASPGLHEAGLHSGSLVSEGRVA